MARARARNAALPAVRLTAASAAALLGPDDLAPAGATAALGAAAAVQNLRDLTEYEPPALPTAPAGGAMGFTAAGMAPAAAPPVPITYDVARRTWLLLADYSYSYGENVLTAKAGYAYDLSSVPRPLWWLIAPNELSVLAPLFHDLLYEYHGRLPADQVAPYRTYTRRETDDLFYHLMEVEGVAAWRRRAAYTAVRAAGELFWAT